MLRTLAVLLAVLPGLSARVPAAASEIRVEVKDFGEYELVTTGQYPAPRTVSGQAHSVANIRLVRQTDTIFAQPGVHFGYRYRIRGELDAESRLIARTVHPPLTNPATGHAATVSELDVALPLDPSNQYDGYSFDHGWEIAEGIWRFQLILDGEIVHEQRFRVVVPLN